MESKSEAEDKIDENGFIIRIKQGLDLQQQEIVPNEKVAHKF